MSLLIKNGTVIDGTGKPRFSADVLVENGTITEIGTLPPDSTADTIVDATGLIVAPGFIDIHTHADIALLARPDHAPKALQGVTTEVFTNCGLGFSPVSGDGLATQKKFIAGLFGDDAGVDWNWHSVSEFLSHYAKRGVATNLAYLVPHGALRVSAMGMEERPANANELRRMENLLAQGMEEGAWGMSTGVWYAPMRAADRAELVTLTRRAGFFATHQRDYGTAIFEATNESLAIAEEAGVPVQISHLQMNGDANKDRAPEILGLLDLARARGIDVTCDTYPYTAGSTFVQSLLPVWATQDGPDGILRHLADPDSRRAIEDFLRHSNLDWSRYALVGATSPSNAPYEGWSFDAIAIEWRMDVCKWVCALLEEEELRACYIHHAAHESNVRTILQWDHQMVGSDGLHLPGKTHPRLYGTFPRILGHYVREERVIDLETAIYKMTAAPAARLHLKKRGILATGYAADITVFDPKTVRDTATFDAPLQYPIGIPYVFVNGIATKFNDLPTGNRPGTVLKK